MFAKFKSSFTCSVNVQSFSAIFIYIHTYIYIYKNKIIPFKK